MFEKDFNNEAIPPRLKNASASKEAMDFLLDLMCDNEHTSPERKAPLLIMRAHSHITAAVTEIVKKYANPETDDVAAFEVRMKVVEYLGLVETGLRQFMDTVKLPEETT